MATALAVEGKLILPDPIGNQPAWLDSPAARKLLRVGRRGMKTRFAFIASLAGHGPGWEDGTPKFPGVLQGVDVVWIAQDYPNLKRVVWREEIKPRFAHLPWANLNEQDHALTLDGLGTLWLASAEAINGIRGMGKNIGGIIVDEAAWLALRAALLDVILPILLDNDGWLIIMSTTNAGPDSGYDDTGAPQVPSYFNLLCKEIQAGKRSGEWVEFTGTAFDNPTLNPSAINELIAEYPPDSPSLKQEVFVELLESGVGLALPGIAEASHMVPAFSPPEYWHQWAAFDWGYHHPWAFGHFTVDDDGQVFQRESLSSRLDLPEQIDAKVRAAGIDPSKIAVHAGPDAWRTRVSNKGTIKGEFTGPTVAERLIRMGWRLIPAADARVAGLNNMREYTYIDPKRPETRPRFLWMETPGNKTCLAQVARMAIDPDRVEDALKVDADAAGRGGDDGYDCVRYGLMARPLPARVPAPADREGVSLGFDFVKNKPRERETGDSLMQQMLGGGQNSPTSGRYRVPVRRG